MARYLCKGSVTGDRDYKAGDSIELSEKQAAQLIEVEAIEPAPLPPDTKKSDPAPASKSTK